MEIVIKINKKEMEMVKNSNKALFIDVYKMMVQKIQNGVVLPENHGDLIDRRELKKEVYTTTEWNGDVHRIIYEASIDDAKPIIEADKGILEKINEKQDSLRATCKAWDEAIEKDGYVN